MVMRPMMVRRRPLLRAAAVGGTFAAGRAMGRRAQERDYAEADQAQAAQGQAAPAQAGQAPAEQGTQPSGGSMMDQLNQLSALHEQGALSDEEFAAAKAKILGS